VELNERQLDNFFAYFLGVSLFDNTIQYKRVLSDEDKALFFSACKTKLIHFDSVSLLISYTGQEPSVFYTTPLYKNLLTNFKFFLNKKLKIIISESKNLNLNEFQIVECQIQDENFCVGFDSQFYKTIFQNKLQLFNDDLCTVDESFASYFYKKFKIFHFDLEIFLRHLSASEIQTMLNTLLKEKKMSISMLAGVMSFPEYADILFSHLSTNIKRDIGGISQNTALWASQSLFLMKEALKKLCETQKLHLPSVDFLFKWKQKREEAYFHKLIQLIIKKKIIIDEIVINNIPSFILAKALVNRVEAQEFFKSKMRSKRKLDIFLEDLVSAKAVIYNEHFSAMNIVQEKFIDELFKHSGLISDDFFDTILSLDKDKLFFLMEDIGIMSFSKVFFKTSKKIKQELLEKMPATAMSILKNLFTEHIRYKEAFGKETINSTKQLILKLYYKNILLGI